MYDIDLTPDFDEFSRRNNNDETFQPLQRLRTDKPMTKSELAGELRISERTLRRWLKKIRAEEIYGYRRGDKILTPGILKILAERLCL